MADLTSHPPIPEGFPEGFKVQHIGISAAIAVAELPAADIANYFREHSDIADALLGESYDKRYTPSTFIEEKGHRFRVGWFARNATYHCVQEFSAWQTPLLIISCFSLGKGRWTPPK